MWFVCSYRMYLWIWKKAFYWLVPHHGLIWSLSHSWALFMPSNVQRLPPCGPATKIQDRFQAMNTDSCHIACLPSKQYDGGQQQHPHPLWYRLTVLHLYKSHHFHVIESEELSPACDGALKVAKTVTDAEDANWRRYLFVIYMLMKGYFRKDCFACKFADTFQISSPFPRALWEVARSPYFLPQSKNMHICVILNLIC